MVTDYQERFNFIYAELGVKRTAELFDIAKGTAWEWSGGRARNLPQKITETSSRKYSENRGNRWKITRHSNLLAYQDFPDAPPIHQRRAFMRYNWHTDIELPQYDSDAVFWISATCNCKASRRKIQHRLLFNTPSDLFPESGFTTDMRNYFQNRHNTAYPDHELESVVDWEFGEYGEGRANRRTREHPHGTPTRRQATAEE